mmetsp:Transcript_1060/g.2981  ORF Transcript_1060/g.2981 Transcript_1060/m.2981 type:complete len:202 (-) Transcript_1060:856-1461(-)
MYVVDLDLARDLDLLRVRLGFLLLRGCRVLILLVIILVNVHAFVKLLQQVGRDVLVHAEHGNALVASHDGLKLCIAKDLSLVIGVLQIVGPNVHPKGLSHLRTGEDVLPTNVGQRRRQTVWGLLSRRSFLLFPLLPGGSLAFFGRAGVFGQINRRVGVDVRSDILVHRELQRIKEVKLHQCTNSIMRRKIDSDCTCCTSTY